MKPKASSLKRPMKLMTPWRNSKRETTQITNIRNEREDITTTNIKRIIRSYNGQLNTHINCTYAKKQNLNLNLIPYKY